MVVQDQQVPFYSKVAIVPYSMAVNVGATYAPQVRGATPPKTITGVTKANPAVVTIANHGFNTGDKIFISGGGRMTQLPNSATATPNATNNPQFWVVNKLTDDTFSLRKCSNSSCSSVADVSSTSWGDYTANSATAACTTVGCTYLTFQRDSDNAWRTWLPIPTTA